MRMEIKWIGPTTEELEFKEFAPLYAQGFEREELFHPVREWPFRKRPILKSEPIFDLVETTDPTISLSLIETITEQRIMESIKLRRRKTITHYNYAAEYKGWKGWANLVGNFLFGDIWLNFLYQQEINFSEFDDLRPYVIFYRERWVPLGEGQ